MPIVISSGLAFLSSRFIARVVSNSSSQRGMTLNIGGHVYRSMGEAFAKLLRTYSVEELEFLVRYHHATIELTKQETAKVAVQIARSHAS